MITKEAKDKTNLIRKQYFFNSARLGFKCLLEKIFIDKKKIILLPSYIGESNREGSGVFDPIRILGLNYEFYELNQFLSVNLDDFKEKIKIKNLGAVLVIHYFGFPQQNITKIVKLCQQHNVLLIEDCAHTFQSSFAGMRLGNFGDFSFYSIHKLIATEDGGILQINNKDYLFCFNEVNNTISKSTLDIYNNTDIFQTSLIRRKNYNLLLKKINQNSKVFQIYFPKLITGIVPLNFPVLLKTNNREQIYWDLVNKCIAPVSLYYRLIPELMNYKYPTSHHISERILNLPIHQDLTSEDINYIAEVINTY